MRCSVCCRKLGFSVLFLCSLVMGGAPSGALLAQRIPKQSYKPAYGNHVFPKKASLNPSRIPSPVKKSSQVRSSQVSPSQVSPSRSRSSLPSRSRAQRPPQQFNQHSFYSSRSSAGQVGRSIPVYSSGTRYVGPGFSASYYDPYLYGNRGVVLGTPVYQPFYETYGTYLSLGAPVGGGASFGGAVVDSSVAAEAFQRAANGQAIVPGQLDPNSALASENMRLQIELERARQQLALQNQGPLPVQQALKPAIANGDNANVNADGIDPLGLAAIIETNQLAADSQLRAERAFRSGDYGKAARFASLAVSLDESNGKLVLFASQSHFANGEYREAAETLAVAIAILPADDLGFVIENFRLFYGQNDFVAQTRALSEYLQQSPEDGSAWMLRGYQYGALGYPDAASMDLDRARSLGVFQQSITVLESRFTAKH